MGCAGGAAPYQDLRIPSFSSSTLDPNIKPLSVALANIGTEYQLNPKLVVAVRWSYSHLRNAIEDIGTLDQFGNNTYIYGNPGEGLTTKTLPSSKLSPSFAIPRAKRNFNALEFSINRRFASNFFFNASYVYSRLRGNYSGIVSTDETRPPSTGLTSLPSQSFTGQPTRPGTSSSRYYDFDYLMYDAHGNLNNYQEGALASDRPSEFKFYGAYELSSKRYMSRDWGTSEIGGFYLAESGTPQTTQVMSTDNAPIYVNGRGDLGRGPAISQTDLVISHTIKLGEKKALRFEFNAQNVFNQKAAQLIYTFYNRYRTNSSEINTTKFNFTQPYDYKALVAATSDATSKPYGALDPRFGKQDLFRTGFVGRFGVKFTF